MCGIKSHAHFSLCDQVAGSADCREQQAALTRLAFNLWCAELMRIEQLGGNQRGPPPQSDVVSLGRSARRTTRMAARSRSSHGVASPTGPPPKHGHRPPAWRLPGAKNPPACGPFPQDMWGDAQRPARAQ